MTVGAQPGCEKSWQGVFVKDVVENSLTWMRGDGRVHPQKRGVVDILREGCAHGEKGACLFEVRSVQVEFGQNGIDVIFRRRVLFQPGLNGLIGVDDRAVIPSAKMKTDGLEAAVGEVFAEVHRNLAWNHDFLFAGSGPQQVR